MATEGGGGAYEVVDTAGMTKPRNEKNVQYRMLRLANGIEAMLVSDPDTDKSSAAVDVRVGHLSDPAELPGLAHFTEHMLFYASEKYPKEDEYSKFISEHGGFSNAYTAAEDTNYHFDVNSGDFMPALDRFAQFFVSPLISPDGVSREMKAVDSENSKNLNSDPWRSMQMWRHVSKPDHVFHKFGTGSLETLLHEPKSKGIDTHKELLSFYSTNYSANLMKLAVYAREPLDELEKAVSEMFGHVKTTSRPVACFEESPFSSEHECKLVKVVPVRNGDELDLQWLVPPENRVYHLAPCHYLSHLIGHEGDGSILKLLKDLKWANTLSAGESPESYSSHSLFLVSIELTEEGNNHVMEIICIVFQYISMLLEDGLQNWIFDELKNVAETRFHFRDKPSPISYARNLTSSMHLYKTEDLLLAMHHVPLEFSKEAVLDVLSCMTVDKVRIMWSSRSHQGKTDAKEPWYGTEHSVEKVSEEFVTKWATCGRHEKLHLPVPNRFVPTQFGILEVEGEPECPEVVYESSMSKLWFKPDTLFKTPKGQVYLRFSLPESYTSPEAAVCTNLFTKMLVDSMNEVTYYAEVAGLSYSIQSTTLGLSTAFSGYSDKLLLLVEEVVDRIASFKSVEDRFNVLREQMQKQYYNTKFDQPYQQALYMSSVMFLQTKWHINEYLEILPDLTFADFERFMGKLLSRVSIQSFIIGNIASESGIDLIKQVEKTLSDKLGSKSVFPSQMPEKRVIQLAKGKDYIHVSEVANEVEENSAVDLVFQVGIDCFCTNVLIQLWAQIAERSAFHKLRTVEQIGYIVCVTHWSDHNVKSVHFILQSTSHHPQRIDKAVEEFLVSFQTRLEEMEDKELKEHIDALISVKEEKLKTLSQEGKKFWREIDEGSLHFQRKDREVAALKTVTKEDLVKFSTDTFSRSSDMRSKVSVHFVSQKAKPSEEKDVHKESGVSEEVRMPTNVDCIWSFKRSMPVFPACAESADSV